MPKDKCEWYTCGVGCFTGQISGWHVLKHKVIASSASGARLKLAIVRHDGKLTCRIPCRLSEKMVLSEQEFSKTEHSEMQALLRGH